MSSHRGCWAHSAFSTPSRRRMSSLPVVTLVPPRVLTQSVDLLVGGDGQELGEGLLARDLFEQAAGVGEAAGREPLGAEGGLEPGQLAVGDGGDERSGHVGAVVEQDPVAPPLPELGARY